MKNIRLKYVLWICLLFTLIGVMIYVPLSVYLPGRITAQILKRDIKIAEYISQTLKDPLLTKDNLNLHLLLHDNLENLQDAEYIFLQDGQGEIIAHTFGQGFPKDLVDINRIKGKQPNSIKKFNVGGREFYDLAVPLFAGGVKSLHLGVSLKSGKKEIAEFARLNYFVAGVILFGVGLGFLGFWMVGLYEVKKISTLEERNRIAHMLHDGLAQSLASVVLRLEVCQRLFEKKPKEAMEELKKLKENARELVTSARRAINKDK